jgi:hypothetical protein
MRSECRAIKSGMKLYIPGQATQALLSMICFSPDGWWKPRNLPGRMGTTSSLHKHVNIAKYWQTGILLVVHMGKTWKMGINVIRKSLIPNLIAFRLARSKAKYIKSPSRTLGIPYPTNFTLTPGMCKGRNTASNRLIAAPRECPTVVTEFVPNCAIPVRTAERTSRAALKWRNEHWLSTRDVMLDRQGRTLTELPGIPRELLPKN